MCKSRYLCRSRYLQTTIVRLTRDRLITSSALQNLECSCWVARANDTTVHYTWPYIANKWIVWDHWVDHFGTYPFRYQTDRDITFGTTICSPVLRYQEFKESNVGLYVLEGCSMPSLVMGGSRRGGAQGARAPSKPVLEGRSGRIGSVLSVLPVRFQNALKHAWNRTKSRM